MSIKPFILYTKIIYNWFKKSAYLLIIIAIRVVYCVQVYIINIFFIGLWLFQTRYIYKTSRRVR